MMCGNGLTADGLPLMRQERGTDDYDDILAGNDFLSVFLQTSMRRARKEITTETEEPMNFLQDTIITEPYVRTSREAGDYFEQVPITTEGQNNNLNVSDSASSDGVIISVHVSSSVGSQNNIKNHITDVRTSEATTQGLDHNFLSSEEHASIVAKSSKSELSVEEPVPITMSNDDARNDPSMKLNNFQATLQNFPSSQHITFNPTNYKENTENLPPFHHSFIYHDNPKEPGRARSVSYSTIIQAIPQTNEKNPEAHERKERNYDTGIGYRNSFDSTDSKRKSFSDDAKSDPITSTSSTTTTQSSTSWEGPLRPTQRTDSSDSVNSERPYSSSSSPSKLPMVYGRPEQNYEVDEAVSVVTNGRAHGVQDDQLLGKKKTDDDKDQKFGYVVEGRNYRKYRVEERTPDGFIVGEYGVVSHDDGSLRGVRYTADGTINPRLIYDALMKFLSL